MTAFSDDVQTVLNYHEQTKHRFDRYARSLGYMDWETQPDPFRRYPDAPLIHLERPEPGDRPYFDELWPRGAIPPEPVSRQSLAQLFYDSFALSAWKKAGGLGWSLRCNPSSGNLHPSEIYLLAGGIDGFCENPALFHYTAIEHAVELRGESDAFAWAAFCAPLPLTTFFVGISSIHWREAWKYGERAYRYCQHDVGHAIAALTYAAAALGWRVRLLSIDDASLARLLAIAQQKGEEREQPDCLLAVLPMSDPDAASIDGWRLDEALLAGWENGLRRDKPNRLSGQHHAWAIIDAVANACRISDAKPWPQRPDLSSASLPRDLPRPLSARALFRERRSAVAMDGKTFVALDDFVRICRRLLPGELATSAMDFSPLIHPVFFIHRVSGLKPGLYLLLRARKAERRLRDAIEKEWEWLSTGEWPKQLPLYRLAAADAREAAKALCCHQTIAGDGAFTIAMLAEFERPLREFGASEYRRMHWKAGALGQALYLEAEAAGVRGTGIGCFFDDGVHELLGLKDRSFQTIYHFTVGGPLDDPRLQTLPAYFHLREK